jgi:hypothetical protein
VDLKEGAASRGISHAAAGRWHDARALPAAACQADRLVVAGDPATAVRAGVAAVPARMSSAGREDGAAGQRRSAAAEGLAVGRVVPAALRMPARCRLLGRAAAFFRLSGSVLGNPLLIE